MSQIEQLTGQEIAGIISEEDQQFLRRAISENPEAYALWKEKYDFHNRAQVQQWQEAFHPPEVFSRIRTNIRNRRIKRNIRLSSSIAAMAVLLLGAAWFTKIFTKQTPPLTQKPGLRIELQMPDGNTIDLSANQGKVPVGSMTLQNTNKTLRYATTGANKQHRSLATLKVPAGKDYKIELSDGSEIWLNATTTLQFPFAFDGNTREISINGEAYIKVVHNAQKPFLVHLPNSTIQVLGTAFNVNTYNANQEKVALVNGSVKMQAHGAAEIIKPGYEAVGTPQGIQVRPFYADEVLCWKEGIYRFDNASLEEISRVIPRWFGVEVVLDNPQVGRKRFTGRIDRNKPIEKSLELLKAFNDTDYYFSEDGVLHFR